jgi:hypothetical protein
MTVGREIFVVRMTDIVGGCGVANMVVMVCRREAVVWMGGESV